MKSLSVFSLILLAPAVWSQDIYEKNESAMRTAVGKVAPCVVKIETSGGREMATGGGVRIRPGMPVPGGAAVRKGIGPTTGLIVTDDGYVITSAFNFANNPTDIFVTVPGKQRLVAKPVATDTTRMLTLLKIEAKDLPVPVAYPKHEVQIGQWCLAIGRTLNPDITDIPAASAGIISALDRMHGKVMQTDAKVSPVNYGGPLVSIDGRVFGVLVPASPRGEGEVSGVEWYDSGIGFAVPLEDVFRILPKLREGRDLRRGILGITPKTQDQYLEEPIVGTVSPESAAEKAGIKPGDRIAKIDGRSTPHFFAVQTALGPKYEGDKIDVVVIRDGKEIEYKGLMLTGSVAAFSPGFLGILPMRDDPEPGVEVRYVYEGSPAEQSGIKPGDRILKATQVLPEGAAGPPVPVLRNRNQLLSMISALPSGAELNLEIKRKDNGKTDKVKVKLSTLPDGAPAVLPMPSSKEKASVGTEEPKEKEEPKKDNDEKKEIETGLLRRKNTILGREYWLYVPKNYRPNVSYGVIVWLHNTNKGGKDAEEIIKIWGTYLEQMNFLMLGPKSTNAEGWVASETEGIIQDLKDVVSSYTVDRTRIVAHGEGVGGQMAAYLGFNAREYIRGVAMTGATLGTAPKDNLPGQRINFFVIAGDKHPDFKEIEAAPAALREKKHPTVWRPIKDLGKEYMDQPTLTELGHWLDSLDRI